MVGFTVFSERSHQRFYLGVSRPYVGVTGKHFLICVEFYFFFRQSNYLWGYPRFASCAYGGGSAIVAHDYGQALRKGLEGCYGLSSKSHNRTRITDLSSQTVL